MGKYGKSGMYSQSSVFNEIKTRVSFCQYYNMKN